MMRWNRSGLLVGLLVMAVCGGCAQTIKITPDASLVKAGIWPSFDVDIIGVDERDLDRRLRNIQVDTYFDSATAFRAEFSKDAWRVVFNDENIRKEPTREFSSEGRGEFAALFSRWRKEGKTKLFIIASIPAPPGAGQQGYDPRIEFIPIPSGKLFDGQPWKDNQVEIVVRSSGLEIRGLR